MAFLYGAKGWAQLSLFELSADDCKQPLKVLNGD